MEGMDGDGYKVVMVVHHDEEHVDNLYKPNGTSLRELWIGRGAKCPA